MSVRLAVCPMSIAQNGAVRFSAIVNYYGTLTGDPQCCCQDLFLRSRDQDRDLGTEFSTRRQRSGQNEKLIQHNATSC